MGSKGPEYTNPSIVYQRDRGGHYNLHNLLILSSATLGKSFTHHSDKDPIIADATAAGRGGIALAPCFILQPLIDAGRLQRVLPDWNTPRLPIHAVYPTRRHLSVKVQAMANFLKDWFGAQ